jgi:hypothetical protein
MKSLKAFPQLLLWLAAPALANNHVVPPVQPATWFAAVDEHTDEKVAIAAEPYDTLKKEAIFRVDYLSHGVIPIRVIVTNNSDRPISLLEARIIFITAAGDRIEVAQPADVERVISSRRHAGGESAPPNSKFVSKPGKRDIDEDFDTFEYRALMVEPHSTRTGFVFYDISRLEHPLEGAKLSLETLRNADGAELFEFEIPFDKYLKSNSGPAN